MSALFPFCLYCWSPLVHPDPGRKKDCCDNACKQKAYRRRRADQVRFMRAHDMGHRVPLRWVDYRTPFPWEDRTGPVKYVQMVGDNLEAILLDEKLKRLVDMAVGKQ